LGIKPENFYQELLDNSDTREAVSYLEVGAYTKDDIMQCTGFSREQIMEMKAKD